MSVSLYRPVASRYARGRSDCQWLLWFVNETGRKKTSLEIFLLSLLLSSSSSSSLLLLFRSPSEYCGSHPVIAIEHYVPWHQSRYFCRVDNNNNNNNNNR